MSLAVPERARQIEAFLGGCGWGAAERAPLEDDASFRRYERVARGGETAVLMDAPPPMTDLSSFVRVDRLLLDLDLSAPRPIAVDEQAGLMLLEDFGDRTFTRVLGAGSAEAPLYELAVDLLIALHARFAAGEAEAGGLPPYDDERLLEEVTRFLDWYLPEVTGRDTPAGERAAFLEAWRALFPIARAVPDSLVLRDYHLDNLMLLDGREGVGACGLLDFQDAVIGPVTYDLVSLLEDARRDVSAELAESATARYLASAPHLDRADFEASCAVLGAQRNTKIIGLFVRLWRRDGKPGYLPHIARVWHLLERDLAHEALVPLRDWFDRVLPAELRRVPEERA